MPKRTRQAPKSPSKANTENDTGATTAALAATTSTGVNASCAAADSTAVDPKHLAMQTLCDAWTHTKTIPGCLVGVWKDDKEVHL